MTNKHNPLSSLGSDPSRILTLFAQNYKSFSRQMFKVFGINGRIVAHKLANKNQDELYEVFDVYKKRGNTTKARTVYSPEEILKLIQKDLDKLIKLQFTPDPISHGFEPGRSTVTAAKAILNTEKIGDKMATNIDVAGAFPAIDGKAIRRLLNHKWRSIQFGKLNQWQVCIISRTLTTSNDKLAMGAPSSPTVFNWRLTSLDKQLRLAGKKRDWTFIRYADDISVIHRHGQKREVVEFLIMMLKGLDLTIARDKIKSFRGTFKKVLGLNVEHGEIRIPRKTRNTRRILAYKLKNLYNLPVENNYSEEDCKIIIKTLPFELQYTKDTLESQLTGYLAYTLGVFQGQNKKNLRL
jgi:hypothetical protein